MSGSGDMKSFTGISFSPRTDSGERYDDTDEKNLFAQKKDLERKRYEEDTEHRRILVHWVMQTSNIWISCVVFIVIFCGAGVFSLSDVVLTTLLATTTATILGLPLVVLRGLFKDNE